MYLCIVQIMTDIRYFIDYTIYIKEDDALIPVNM